MHFIATQFPSETESRVPEVIVFVLRPYDMRLAQTIAHVLNKETGQIEPLVDEMVLPSDLKETQPGYYMVDFCLSVSQKKRIESVVNSLTPCDAKGNPLRAPEPQKQAA